MFYLLLGLSGFVLLIACATLANHVGSAYGDDTCSVGSRDTLHQATEGMCYFVIAGLKISGFVSYRRYRQILTRRMYLKSKP
jgi:hypothetical protein